MLQLVKVKELDVCGSLVLSNLVTLYVFHLFIIIMMVIKLNMAQWQVWLIYFQHAGTICDCLWENRSYRPFKSIEKRRF